MPLDWFLDETGRWVLTFIPDENVETLDARLDVLEAGIGSSVVPALVAELQTRMAAVELALATRPFLTYVQETDPVATEDVQAGETWGKASTSVINLRDPTNMFWIPFGAGVPDVPAETPNVLLLEDDTDFFFDDAELIEFGKLSGLDAAATPQPTDLIGLVQTADAPGVKVALLDLLTDALLTCTDVTTNDVSNDKHGFCPKLPNDADLYLRGDGTWAAIP